LYEHTKKNIFNTTNLTYQIFAGVEPVRREGR